MMQKDMMTRIMCMTKGFDTSRPQDVDMLQGCLQGQKNTKAIKYNTPITTVHMVGVC